MCTYPHAGTQVYIIKNKYEEWKERGGEGGGDGGGGGGAGSGGSSQQQHTDLKRDFQMNCIQTLPGACGIPDMPPSRQTREAEERDPTGSGGGNHLIPVSKLSLLPLVLSSAHKSERYSKWLCLLIPLGLEPTMSSLRHPSGGGWIF